MNILITSIGRRTTLLEYFKNEFANIGKIIVTDCNKLAPALYLADNHYIVPTIDQPNYINTLIKICKQEKITAIFSLIDMELSILAEYSSDFKKLGVTTIVSPLSVCKLWLDKFSAYDFCKTNNLLHAKSYVSFNTFIEALNANEVQFPVFIKPRRGSASLNIGKANNLEEAKFLFNSSNEMIIQEFLDGQELGVDVYVDLISKEVTNIFIKEKISMRAGETDKAISIKSKTVFTLVEQVVKKSGLIGPIDIDLFFVKNKYYISEINPRFGGGYPFAHECGINFPKLIINNLRGFSNKVIIGDYDENVIMMKHDTIMVKNKTWV